MGLGDVRHGNLGLGDAGTWDAVTRESRDVGNQDVINKKHLDFVIYNFWWSRGRYYMLKSLSADQYAVADDFQRPGSA